MNAPYGFSPGGSNPYAAPHVRFPGFGPPLATGPILYRAHSATLKWGYLGSMLAGIALVILGAALEESVGMGIVGLGVLFAFFGPLFFTIVWLHSAWAAIPADYRVTANGKRVSPGEAVGFLFVPFYNLYWMFVASGGLCDALDYLLRSAGSPHKAPKTVSLLACIFQLVPYLNSFVAPFMWFFFMFTFDRAARALESAAASGSGASPQGFGGGGYPPPAGGFGAPLAGGYGGPPPGYGPPR